MAWVVDTSVLLDIHLADAEFARASAECLASRMEQGLVVCPVSFIELAPAFGGDAVLQEKFLAQVGIEWPMAWTLEDTRVAHRLWSAHIADKRAQRVGKRPVADILIEAFASRFQGLITRNPRHFGNVRVEVP